jgi:hypothetical protein
MALVKLKPILGLKTSLGKIFGIGRLKLHLYHQKKIILIRKISMKTGKIKRKSSSNRAF